MSNTTNPQTDEAFRTGAGLLYLFTTTFFGGVYAIVLQIIVKSPDLLSKPAYKIIVSMGMADLMQMAGLGAAGLMLIIRCSCSTISRVLIAFCWSYSFAIFICSQTLFRVKLYPKYYSYDFGTETIISYESMTMYDFTFHNTSLAFMALLYGGSIYNLRALRSGGNASTNQLNAEFRLGIQALLIWLSLVALSVVWMVFKAFEFNVMHRYMLVLATMAWITNTAINPCIYVLLNTTIKNKFVGLFGAAHHNVVHVQPA